MNNKYLKREDFNNKIVEKARECIGTPYKHQGRIKGLGLDCVGIPLYIAKELKIEHSDVPGYNMIPAHGLLEKTFQDQEGLIEIKNISEMQRGDVLLFKFTEYPQHAAIYTGKEENTIIHSYSKVEKVCEHRLNDQWLSRLTHVFRFVIIE